jgi:hypothetical protein
LINAGFTDEIVAALVRAPIAARLEALDLSRGTLSDAGAAELARAALPRLAHLDVSESYLSAATIAALSAAFPTVIAASQKPDDGDRYPSVLE